MVKIEKQLFLAIELEPEPKAWNDVLNKEDKNVQTKIFD